MPQSVSFKGQSIVRPGVIIHHDLSQLLNFDVGADASIICIGEASSGQHQATPSTPIVYTFTSADAMAKEFISGSLAEMARCAFKPMMSGQYEQGVPIKGCDVVYAIKTNVSTRSSYTVQDGASHNAVTLYSKRYGVVGDQVWFTITASGTGIVLVAGRSVAPDIGSETSPLFSVTSVDEWISVTFNGVAATCTMTFDGTTFTTATAGAVDDLSIACTGKTVTEIVGLINAAASGDYVAAVLRPERANTLFTYIDRFSAVNIRGVVASQMGVAYDVYYWVENYSGYLSAAWGGGYEPQAYLTTYLVGGTLGDSTTDTVSGALRTAAKLNIRHVVSGFDTDSVGGAVSLAVANGYFTDHATAMNALQSPRERHVYISNDDITKAAMYVTIGALNNEYVCCCNNRVYREGPDGIRAWLGPHCVATMAAAIRAGSPKATSLTWKFIEAYDYDFVAVDFDDSDETDYINGIRYGLLFLESEPGEGIRFAKGISTYRLEDVDGRIMLETVEARLWHRVILRKYLQRKIGSKGAGLTTANEILRRATQAHKFMANAKDPDFVLVAGTDANGSPVPAYRNLTVTLNGDRYYLSGEVTLVAGVTWIFGDFVATAPSALVSS